MRDNVARTDNQQGSSWNVIRNPSETTRRAPLIRAIAKAYLFGAMHDGTRRPGRRVRIAQRDIRWLYEIRRTLDALGYRSWIYREGRTRNLYILESVAPIFQESFAPDRLMTVEEKCAFLRSFFDAEGGVPRNPAARRYVQLVQKNHEKVLLVKRLLQERGISTGKVHNPSKRVDPGYWRVFVRASSITRFAQIIGSQHPRKRAVFREWMKI